MAQLRALAGKDQGNPASKLADIKALSSIPTSSAPYLAGPDGRGWESKRRKFRNWRSAEATAPRRATSAPSLACAKNGLAHRPALRMGALSPRGGVTALIGSPETPLAATSAKTQSRLTLYQLRSGADPGSRGGFRCGGGQAPPLQRIFAKATSEHSKELGAVA